MPQVLRCLKFEPKVRPVSSKSSSPSALRRSDGAETPVVSYGVNEADLTPELMAPRLG
jgi:hypothetical protein